MNLNLTWPRPIGAEPTLEPVERRVRDYLEGPGGFSESARSLADKLGLHPRECRRILEQLVEQGTVRRQEFVDIEPLYSRFPTRSTMTT